MKNMIRFTPSRLGCLGAAVLCAGLLNGRPLLAGDAKQAIQTPAEEPIFSNWINMSLGGLIPNGNEAEFRRQNPGANGPIFGGIDDMHLEKSFGKALLTVDARAIFANSDYKVKIELSQPDLGFVRAGFTEFCTYSNGNGGYLPANSLMENAMGFTGPQYALYRGSIWLEAGLRIPNLPELTFRYEHAFRDGQKDSTSWGGTNQVGINPAPSQLHPATNSVTRKVLPSFRNINEARDIFTFDGKYLFGKPEQMGNTEVNLGMRYEFDNTKDSLNFQTISAPSPTPLTNNINHVPQVASSYFTTQADQLSLAMYDGHISSVTRFGDKLWLTSAYSYSAASSNTTGSRVGGPAYDSTYTPYLGNVAYGNVPRGAYIDLGGGSNVGTSIAALNLMWMPFDYLTISPSLRVECSNTNSSSNFLTENSQSTTNGSITTNWRTGKVTNKPAALVAPATLAAYPTLDTSHIFLTDIAESLQIRFTKIENVVLYAQLDWDQQFESRGDVTPNGSYYAPTIVVAGKVVPNTPANTPTPYNTSSKLNLSANNQLLDQKYAVGANWYPLMGLNFAAQYYLQLQDISQNINSDDPVRTNQRLVFQRWNTNDVNFRVTWQPLSNLSLVTRYDYQRTLIYSQWNADPNTNRSSSFAGQIPAGQSSLMTNNMLTESVTWSPLDRLYINGSLSYVLNQISSPASSITPAITNSNNNYWTASAGFGFAIDPKTELRGDFAFYSANNYVNNAANGVPYGAGNSEYSFTASLNRQISRNVSMSVKYYMEVYRDTLSGGMNNFTGQMITSSLQVHF